MAERKLVAKVSSLYRNKIRECRLKALIQNQSELAMKTGISRTTLNALEKQKLFLSSTYGLLIADVLGVSLSDLYEKVPTNSIDMDI